MMLRPTAEKDPFKKNKTRTLVIGTIILALIIFSTFYYFNKKEEPLPPSYVVCDLEQDAIINKFVDYNFDEKLVLKDHFFYGETLSIFENDYNIKEPSSLLGKTLILFNICTEKEYFYLIDADVDGQIPLDQLPLGFYEVFINIDMVKKRLVTDDKFTDSINLVRRNNESTQVNLISDKNLFDDNAHQNHLNANYLFLDVFDSKNNNQDYDIVLDPDYATNPSGWHDNFGPTVDGMRAADEILDAAKIIKKELEEAGLKVLITRNNYDEIINVYGKEGRLEKAYDSKAKYYISLSWGSFALGGLKVYHSSFSSIRLASSIAKHLLTTTNLDAQNDTGIYMPLRFSGLDGNMNIREIGGKALSAATFSDLAKNENSSFALDNPYGLEAIYIEYISVNDTNDVTNWKTNKEIYAKETAHAIIESLDINKGGNDDLSD